MHKIWGIRGIKFRWRVRDGNPLEVRKIDKDKNVFPKKNNNFNFAKIKNSNRNLIINKIHKSAYRISIYLSYKNVIKRKFYKINDLKEKSNSDRINTFISNEGNFKN